MSERIASAVTVAALALAACSPARGPSDRVPAQEPDQSSLSQAKALTLPLEGEPRDTFVTSMFGGSGTIAGDLKPAVHQPLVSYDERGGVHPRLATELPTLANRMWVVRQDGTMQTTYQIRRDVTWHDGTPLTARDFVFGWTVTRDPEMPVSTRVISSQISRIDTPDDFTLVMEWTKTYPLAGTIVDDDLGPLPSHILEAVYRTSKDQLPNHPFWRQEFIGVGPYQLADWQFGSHLVLQAYPGFFGGRAKIDTITFRFISDPSTVMANLLAGSLDGAFAGIDFDQVMFVKEEWERAGKRPVLATQTTHWQMIGIQFRPGTASPSDVLDVRVRRGLLYGLDRKELADAMFGGLAAVSHWFIPEDDVRWEWVKDTIVRYDYDPRRSQEALASAGWRRGSDGAFLNAAGERVVFPYWGGTGEAGARETAIMADSWKSNGMLIEQIQRPRELMQDLQFRAHFPALERTSIPIKFPGTIERVSMKRCPTEETRWAGGNRGCYQNEEMERLIDSLLIAIDPDEQRRLYAGLVRMQTEQLPLLPLFFRVNLTLFREGIVGVRGDTKPRTSVMWNVADWDLVR